MLDIAVDADDLTTSLRVRTDNRHASAAEIASECLEEMKSIKERIAKIPAG